MMLEKLKQYFVFILEKVIYFVYKVDIILLSVFIFAFFFGFFGSPKGLSGCTFAFYLRGI